MKKWISGLGLFAAFCILLANIWIITTVKAAPQSNVIADTKTHYVIHLTNVSDTSTEETDVQKVDKSGLVAPDGSEPAALDLEQIEWNMQGYTYISLEWDAQTTDNQIVVLNGSGYKDFRGVDKGFFDITRSCLKDPRDTGPTSTGDIVLTTSGNASGNTYDITLWFLKASD